MCVRRGDIAHVEHGGIRARIRKGNFRQILTGGSTTALAAFKAEQHQWPWPIGQRRPRKSLLLASAPTRLQWSHPLGWFDRTTPKSGRIDCARPCSFETSPTSRASSAPTSRPFSMTVTASSTIVTNQAKLLFNLFLLLFLSHIYIFGYVMSSPKVISCCSGAITSGLLR